MEQKFNLRTRQLVGEDFDAVIKNRVAVVGLGGVGSYAAEALCRFGFEHLLLWDFDRVDVTNINRQLLALQSTVGELKVDVAKRRYHDINPNCDIVTESTAYGEEKNHILHDFNPDFIVDAIDDIKAKKQLIRYSVEQDVPIISVMGAGNKMDPTRFRVSKLKETHTCPLAKIIRVSLRKEGIENIAVVWSDERPIEKRDEIGTVSYVPAVAGLVAAHYVIDKLLEGE